MDKIKTNKQTKKLIKSLFPDYKGRVTYLSIQDSYNFNSISSFWSGGYKTTVRVIENNGEKLNVKTPKVLDDYGKFLNPLTMSHGSFKIPLGNKCFVVEHQFAGTKQWIHIYAGDEQVELLKAPAPKQLT